MADFLTFDAGDAITLPTVGVLPLVPDIPSEVAAVAVNVEHWILFELPHFQSDENVQLGSVAVRPNTDQAYAQVLVNGAPPETRLNYQLTEPMISDTTVTRLQRTITFTSAVSGVVLIGSEFMRIGAETADQPTAPAKKYNVERGLGDTVPVPHNQNARAWMMRYLWSSGTLNFPQLYPTRIVSRSTSDDVSDGTDSYVFTRGRYRAPICPANIKIDNNYNPSSVIGDVVITYASRLKSSSLDWYAADGQTPEDGTSVVVRISIEGSTAINAIERTVAAVDVGTITISSADMRVAAGADSVAVRLVISAVQGNIVSNSNYAFRFGWSTQETVGWHFDWGNNWGGGSSP